MVRLATFLSNKSVASEFRKVGMYTEVCSVGRFESQAVLLAGPSKSALVSVPDCVRDPESVTVKSYIRSNDIATQAESLSLPGKCAY